MSSDLIKDALRMMPYGFYCITSTDGEDLNAMTANWIGQVSFEPRLVAFGLQKTSYTHRLVEKGRVFAVNLFLKGDSEAIKPFTKGRLKNPTKMEAVKYTLSPTISCPIIAEAAAYVECKVLNIIDIQGDHDLVIAEAVGGGVIKPAGPQDILTLP